MYEERLRRKKTGVIIVITSVFMTLGRYVITTIFVLGTNIGTQKYYFGSDLVGYMTNRILIKNKLTESIKSSM